MKDKQYVQIEVELDKEVYDKLQIKAKEKNMTIDDYCSELIETSWNDGTMQDIIKNYKKETE